MRLANLALGGAGTRRPEVFATLLEEAAHDKERAERVLAERSASFREERARAHAGLSEVAEALPSGGALVAFFRYGRHQVGASVPDAEGVAPPAPTASYVAFVVRSGEAVPALVDVGPAGTVDALVARWRAAVNTPAGADESAAGEALRARVWDEVSRTVAGSTRVFVVPDGSLNLVSFAALPTGDGKRVIETGPTIHYLSAERDLVSPAVPAKRNETLLAMGGPAFDDAAPLAMLASAAAPPKGGALAAIGPREPAAFRGQRSACGDFASLRFAPLDGAEREAAQVAMLWRRTGSRAVHLSGTSATEAAFKARAPHARVIHVATHGFFLGDRCRPPMEGVRGLDALEQAPAARHLVTRENPLLLSGLALAGANRRDRASPDEEDGVLTAQEIASLDLSGVEWAVLSACDTGLGGIRAGEGVFGLRRAFQVAGARTVVMSLWAVDDDATRRWMKELYQARLDGGLETAESVRAASLSILRARRERGASTHPFYWAGFVAAGDWR